VGTVTHVDFHTHAYRRTCLIEQVPIIRACERGDADVHLSDERIELVVVEVCVEDDDLGERGWDVERSATGEVEVERRVAGGRGRCVGRRAWS
jgi:hypothetical protein